MIPDNISARLKLLFIALYRDNEGERSNAASAFYRFLIDNDIHPKDIDMLVGLDLIERNQQMIAHLEGEIKRLATENSYFRHHASPRLLREAALASSIDLARWFAVYDAITARFGDPLPANWQHKVAKLVGVTESVIKRWEVGLVQVPDDILGKLLAAPTAPSKSSPKPQPSGRGKINRNHLNILRNLSNLPTGCTIRSLSLHMYDELDSNENLACVVSLMLDRKWVCRERITKSERTKSTERARWLYYISEYGAQLLNENMAD